jgi:hypothetical protein
MSWFNQNSFLEYDKGRRMCERGNKDTINGNLYRSTTKQKTCPDFAALPKEIGSINH